MPMLSAALIADVQHRLAYQDTGCDPASETMNLVKAVETRADNDLKGIVLDCFDGNSRGRQRDALLHVCLF